MEISLLLAEQIIAQFLMMAVGFAAVKARLFKSSDSKIISNLVVYVCSPCVVLNSFQIDITSSKVMGLLLALAGAIIVHGVLIGGTKLSEKLFHLNAIEKTSIVYSNSGYLIIPLVMAVFGQEWVFYTTAYIMIQTVLLWTHGIGLLRGEKNRDYKKILTNPNIIAIVIGLVLFVSGIKFPGPVAACIGGFSNMIGPASMMVIGMVIGEVDLKWVFRQKRPYFVCFLRLIVFPLILTLIFCMPVLQHFHKDAQYILLMVLLAGSAPAATMITQLAQIYDKDAKYASVINVMSVIFCIATIPLITLLYEFLV